MGSGAGLRQSKKDGTNKHLFWAELVMNKAHHGIILFGLEVN